VQVDFHLSKVSFFIVLTSRVDPRFDLRQDSLVRVAKSTCHIAVKLPDDKFATGTAFFVSATKLITAGHLRYHANSEIVAQYPGVQVGNLNTRELFDDNPPVDTFRCRVLDFRRPLDDMMLLDCSASNYRASRWVEISPHQVSLDLLVDVVGYPGLYEHQYLLDTQGSTASTAHGLDEISELLPRLHLVVSHGPVTGVHHSGKLARYRLSTIGGMSGSAVVANEKAVGKQGAITMSD
jgi:Trypsin-like peptidase domain